MEPILIFKVHATWQTKSGRKGELNRSYVGKSTEHVLEIVKSHLRSDRRFSAVRALDITVTPPMQQGEQHHV